MPRRLPVVGVDRILFTRSEHLVDVERIKAYMALPPLPPHVFQHRIFVTAGDSPTQLHLRASFASAALGQATRMILVMHSHEQLSLEYANQGFAVT